MAHPPADNYRLYGLSVLRERLPALTQELDGLRRNDDTEYVHRMRVASRRARNGLDLFRTVLPEKEVALWRKQLRRVGRALGAARDLDVQAEWIASYLDRTIVAEHFPGIARLLLRLRQQRARQQRTIVRVADWLEREHVIENIAAELHDMIVHARVYEADTLPADLYERSREAILLRTEQFLAFEPFISSPERVTELHEMRIAAKHLRYTLETFAPVYGAKVEHGIRQMKDLQESLGRVHDADVWIEFLPRFIDDERRRTREYFGDERSIDELSRGIEALRSDLVGERQEYYESFVHTWFRAEHSATWTALREAMRPKVVELRPDASGIAGTGEA